MLEKAHAINNQQLIIRIAKAYDLKYWSYQAYVILGKGRFYLMSFYNLRASKYVKKILFKWLYRNEYAKYIHGSVCMTYILYTNGRAIFVIVIKFE